MPIELLGTEDAPGVKEGGVLEHVTHQITIEALPTAIPRASPPTSPGMSIGDTLQLSAVAAPEGVEFALGEGVDPDEVTIATLCRRRGSRRSPSRSCRGGGRAGRRGGRGPRGRGSPRGGRGEGEASGEGGESREGE